MQKETILKLSLDDLVPKEVTFSFPSKPDKQYTLGAFTLRRQLWANKKWTPLEVETSIASRNLAVLSELAYEVLKEKSQFKTLEDFQEAVVTFKDREALANAILETMGISQPLVERLTAELEAEEKKKKGNEESPSQSTGAGSTT